MRWFVYIILCDKKTFYVGYTSDLNKRIGQHKNKEPSFIKKFSEIELVYDELCLTEGGAKLREKQLKGWSVAKKKALIEGKRYLLTHLSRSN